MQVSEGAGLTACISGGSRLSYLRCQLFTGTPNEDFHVNSYFPKQ